MLTFIDIEVFAMVTGVGDWKARRNAHKTVLENHRQRMKNSGSMRQIMLLSVSPFFLCSWLFWLYWLPGGDISDDALSERGSQFRARFFRQASPRISAALAKATAMSLTGAPSLLSPTYLPHRFCASKLPRPC